MQKAVLEKPIKKILGKEISLPFSIGLKTGVAGGKKIIGPGIYEGVSIVAATEAYKGDVRSLGEYPQAIAEKPLKYGLGGALGGATAGIAGGFIIGAQMFGVTARTLKQETGKTVGFGTSKFVETVGKISDPFEQVGDSLQDIAERFGGRATQKIFFPIKTKVATFSYGLESPGVKVKKKGLSPIASMPSVNQFVGGIKTPPVTPEPFVPVQPEPFVPVQPEPFVPVQPLPQIPIMSFTSISNVFNPTETYTQTNVTTLTQTNTFVPVQTNINIPRLPWPPFFPVTGPSEVGQGIGGKKRLKYYNEFEAAMKNLSKGFLGPSLYRASRRKSSGFFFSTKKRRR